MASHICGLDHAGGGIAAATYASQSQYVGICLGIANFVFV